MKIITGNYHSKLSINIYHHAKNVRIIGIMAYSKIYICYRYKQDMLYVQIKG